MLGLWHMVYLSVLGQGIEWRGSGKWVSCGNLIYLITSLPCAWTWRRTYARALVLNTSPHVYPSLSLPIVHPPLCLTYTAPFPTLPLHLPPSVPSPSSPSVRAARPGWMGAAKDKPVGVCLHGGASQWEESGSWPCQASCSECSHELAREQADTHSHEYKGWSPWHGSQRSTVAF